MIKNKKIIVTGGNGFIGSHIVDRLAKSNQVHVIDNLSSDAAEKFYYNKNATYHKADITDYEAIKDIFTDTDYVFHLAAQSYPKTSFRFADAFTWINSVITWTAEF